MCDGSPSAAPAGRVTSKGREIEYRAERTTGSYWDEETADFVDYAGAHVRWRFVGERRWREHTLIPTGDQTVDGILDQIGAIVERQVGREIENAAA